MSRYACQANSYNINNVMHLINELGGEVKAVSTVIEGFEYKYIILYESVKELDLSEAIKQDQ